MWYDKKYNFYGIEVKLISLILEMNSKWKKKNNKLPLQKIWSTEEKILWF